MRARHRVDWSRSFFGQGIPNPRCGLTRDETLTLLGVRGSGEAPA